MEQFYAGAVQAQSEEERAYKEAKMLEDLEVHESFRTAFQRGSYFVIRNGAEQPAYPSNARVLHVGGAKNGQGVDIIVIADKATYGLEAIEQFVVDRRDAWLRRAAIDFNGKPEAERREALKAGTLATLFRLGMTVDEQNALVAVPEK